jgi:hypothetical protein
MSRQLSFALALLACSATIGAREVFAGPPELTQLAQAQTDPSQPAVPATAAPDPTTPDATAPPADAQAPGAPGLQRPSGVQGAPAIQRPGSPAPRRPAPAPQRGKPPKELR